MAHEPLDRTARRAHRAEQRATFTRYIDGEMAHVAELVARGHHETALMRTAVALEEVESLRRYDLRARVHLQRGHAFRGLGEWARAHRAYVRAASVDPVVSRDVEALTRLCQDMMAEERRAGATAQEPARQVPGRGRVAFALPGRARESDESLSRGGDVSALNGDEVRRDRNVGDPLDGQTTGGIARVRPARGELVRRVTNEELEGSESSSTSR